MDCDSSATSNYSSLSSVEDNKVGENAQPPKSLAGNTLLYTQPNKSLQSQKATIVTNHG